MWAELQAFEALQERGVIRDSDALVVDIDSLLFQEKESDGRGDFQDCVEQGVIPVVAQEAEFDVSILRDRSNSGILLLQEADDFSGVNLFADSFEDDQGPESSGRVRRGVL